MPGSLSTTVNNTVDGPTVVNPLDSERAATDLWTRAIHRLKGRLSRHTFQTYFEPIKPVSLEGDELTLAHSSRFMIDWVRDNLLDVLLEDLLQQRGGPCKVQFVVRERAGEQDLDAPPPPPPTEGIEPVAERRPVQLNLNPKYSFESF